MAATDGAPVDVAAIQPENSREVNPLFCPASPENRVCRFGPSIVISKYGGEVQLPAIMELMRRDLSEPYSVFTYRYFVEGWPELCFVVSARRMSGANLDSGGHPHTHGRLTRPTGISPVPLWARPSRGRQTVRILLATCALEVTWRCLQWSRATGAPVSGPRSLQCFSMPWPRFATR